MTKRILIIGATSAIAQGIAKTYAAKHAEIYLVARNVERLETIAADLKIRGAKQVGQYVFDAENFAQQEAMLVAAKTFLGNFDIVLIVYGSLSDQLACEDSVEKALVEFNINALSVISLLTLLAKELRAQRSGVLAVISSVAGDRGRQSNYVYGSAKAMVSTFLQGLRARLYKHNVHVLTIKPGFVDTPMTANLKKNFLFASSQKVANDIVKAIDHKKDILYTPKFWRVIMIVVRLLPEKFAKRLAF